MCLQDNAVWDKVTSSQRQVTVTTTPIEIASPSPYRVGLIFAPNDVAGGGTCSVSTALDGLGFVLSSIQEFPIKQFNWRDVGGLVKKPWYGVGFGGSVTFGVVELLLPAEWWPVFLGQVTTPSSRT